jgi:hypothetical protein
VSITLTLPTIASKRYRRPYVAVWIEDEQKKPVRTLTVWGSAPRYQKDLTYWWQFAQSDKALIKSVTRATRPPGQYQLAWNGSDDGGKRLPQGTYTVVVEVRREHGKHVRQSGTIKCGAEPATAKLEKNVETDETKLEYGPKGK